MIQPAKAFIKEDLRNLNLLSLREDEEEKNNQDNKSKPNEEQKERSFQENLSFLADEASLLQVDISKLSLNRSLGESMQIRIDYDFIERVKVYLNDRKISHEKFA